MGCALAEREQGRLLFPALIVIIRADLRENWSKNWSDFLSSFFLYYGGV
jgi:hypothetical protein